ncbi:tripartite tricarboxylate transporter TctB family protein [Mesobacillus boroniphilus]|uniref:Tripartite tricarboxylate transporter TctB family protein n=1 Tax=Mesobacillus boroniphilus TaxID=308892 RepID=A0A944GVL8_9BACI|nr:tripartite tricarboxylate transporter TctB family protein [Mesobacillus boroniphilus]MBS8263707.1 tripartite tricarboxylate transporter TctB family protein [Mesobacillus boroniphilus]
MQSERKKDLIVSIIVLAISALFYVNTKTLTSPADIFPKVVIFIFSLLGVILLLKVIFYKNYEDIDKSENAEAISNPKRRWISITALILYTILIPIIGFYVTSAIFLTLISVYLRDEKQGLFGYLKPLLLSCLVMVILYGTFNVFLRVPVPAGILI